MNAKIEKMNLPGERSLSYLDIPGLESDDIQDLTGSEEEENNYYSLGEYDHYFLEEDKGE
jgi:hypothetical protein